MRTICNALAFPSTRHTQWNREDTLCDPLEYGIVLLKIKVAPLPLTNGKDRGQLADRSHRIRNNFGETSPIRIRLLLSFISFSYWDEKPRLELRVH
jgi:hypothetical protein